MVDECTYEEWDRAAFLAREGDPVPLANFLRNHAELWPATDIDSAQLADLIEGKLRRPRGKPSAASKKARSENIVLRAVDGDSRPLIERLEALHIEHGCDAPHLRLLAEVVGGDYKRSPGPYPGSRIAQGIEAWPIVKRVREVQDELRRGALDDSLEAAWEAVGAEVHKSAQWVRDEYYRMSGHNPEVGSEAATSVLEGAALLGDEHMKLSGEPNRKKPRRRKST